MVGVEGASEQEEHRAVRVREKSHGESEKFTVFLTVFLFSYGSDKLL